MYEQDRHLDAVGIADSLHEFVALRYFVRLSAHHYELSLVTHRGIELGAAHVVLHIARRSQSDHRAYPMVQSCGAQRAHTASGRADQGDAALVYVRIFLKHVKAKSEVPVIVTRVGRPVSDGDHHEARRGEWIRQPIHITDVAFATPPGSQDDARPRAALRGTVNCCRK